MDKYYLQAVLLQEHFFIAGIGHFDLTTEQTAEVLKALNSKNNKEKIDELYEQYSLDMFGDDDAG
jgi:hypothetical protein